MGQITFKNGAKFIINLINKIDQNIRSIQEE